MRAAIILVALVALLAAPVSAHVRILYTGYPIRNALSASVNGQYSTAGPCGGVDTFGINGLSTFTSGEVVSLVIAYNGGHQSDSNAFHAAVLCGDYNGTTFDDTQFDISTQPVTTSSTPLQVLTDGSASVPAVDSLTTGYTLTFALPTTTVAETCVISLLDQRNWGGCVDIQLNPNTTTSTADVSPCTTYCDDMSSTCTDGNVQYPYNGLDCMTNCANFTVADDSSTLIGNNIQCRQYRVSFAEEYSVNVASNCAAASVPSTANGCFDSIADGERESSPCWKYCSAVNSNCASSNLYSSTNACMESCAAFLTGSATTGPTLACRYAAALDGTCADAAATPTGTCKTAAIVNPLTSDTLSDTLSGVYSTVETMCSTAEERSLNTIAGCCCLSGNFTVLHYQGDSTATMQLNLNTTGGQMCATSNTLNNRTFSSAVTAQTATITLDQTTASSTAMNGTYTIGGDPFEIQLVDGIIIVTNNVPSTRSPRVCSIQATMAVSISTKSATATSAAVQANSASWIMMIATMIVAFVASRRA